MKKIAYGVSNFKSLILEVYCHNLSFLLLISITVLQHMSHLLLFGF